MRGGHRCCRYSGHGGLISAKPWGAGTRPQRALQRRGAGFHRLGRPRRRELGLSFSTRLTLICIYLKTTELSVWPLASPPAPRPRSCLLSLENSLLRPCPGLGTELGPAPRKQDGLPGDTCAVWDMHLYIHIYIIADSAWPRAAGSSPQPDLVCIPGGAGTALLLHPWSRGSQKSPFPLAPSPGRLLGGTEREDLVLQRSMPNPPPPKCTHACVHELPGSTGCLHRAGTHGSAHAQAMPRRRGAREQTGGCVPVPVPVPRGDARRFPHPRVCSPRNARARSSPVCGRPRSCPRSKPAPLPRLLPAGMTPLCCA